MVLPAACMAPPCHCLAGLGCFAMLCCCQELQTAQDSTVQACSGLQGPAAVVPLLSAGKGVVEGCCLGSIGSLTSSPAPLPEVRPPRLVCCQLAAEQTVYLTEKHARCQGTRNPRQHRSNERVYASLDRLYLVTCPYLETS